ncbi:MAG TPA: IS110 family transposase [Nocardioidaceae bacterium]|nr:IS110 family transposase [Nocardioidaceae bacterium]
MSEYAGQQFVGIDLHRRRSVIVRTTAEGEVLEATRISNDVEMLTRVIGRAGESPEVVLEATYGWYWAVDALRQAGAQVHLAHPLGVKAFEYRRVKNDFRDAADLADLLRMGRLPQAWIAPPATRELRELVRHRAKLVGLRSHCKAEIHAVLAKCGVQVTLSDLFGIEGSQLLDRVALPAPYAARVQSLRRLIDDLQDEVDRFTQLSQGRLAGEPGFVALQQLPGVGQVLAAVFWAEVGDVGRFDNAHQLACWAGLTPKHHESDTHVHRGRITKQGSRLVRWAAVESVKTLGSGTVLGAYKKQVADRRGKNIGAVAAARKQTEFVFYALRDHHVRALHRPVQVPAA